MSSLVSVLGWLLSVIAAFGNGFTILLVTRKPSLRSTAGGIFILSLAVADFCLGLTFFPLLYFGHKLEGWNDYFELFLQLLFPYASLANLCALVLDRYFSIVFPLRYTNFITHKRTSFVLVASWMFSVVVAVLNLIHFLTSSDKRVFGSLHTVFFSVTPALILVVTTIHLILVVRRLRQQTMMVTAQLSFNNMSCNVTVNKRYREFDYVKVIAVLVTVFGIFSIVDIAANICDMADTPKSIVYEMNYVVIMLHLINSAINPFVYAYLKRDIRKETKRLLKNFATAVCGVV